MQSHDKCMFIELAAPNAQVCEMSTNG